MVISKVALGKSGESWYPMAPSTAEHRSEGILARANANHTKEKRR